MRRHLAGSLALCLVASGCAQLFGIDPPNEVAGPDATSADGSAPVNDAPSGSDGATDATTNDAGPDGTALDGPVGHDAAPSTVTGRQVIYFVGELTTTPVPTDFSAGITAYVLDPAAEGGTVAYQGGTGDAGAGSFAIEGIPEGAAYYVVVPNGPTSTLYLFNTARVLDLSYYVAGRTNVLFAGADAAPTAPPDTIAGYYSYDLQGVPGGANGFPSVLAYSQGAASLQLTPGSTTDPVTGAPTSDASFDDDAHLTGQDPIYLGQPLSDPAQGDQTYVALFDAVDAGIGQAQAVVRGFSSTSFSMTSSPTVLAGTALPLPPHAGADGGVMVLAWDHDSFLSYMGQISTVNNPRFQSLSVRATPAMAAAGIDYSGQPDIFDYYLGGSSARQGGMEAVTLAYGDLFPPSWGHAVTVNLAVLSPLPVTVPADAGFDASTITVQARGAVACSYPLPYDKPLQPVIGPPQALLVNGQPGFQTHLDAGLQPTVSWLAPATAQQPTYYKISVRHLILAGGSATFEFPAGIFTNQTSVTLPPGILQPGNDYELFVVALYAADGLNAPFREGLPYCSAGTTTGVITP